MENLRIRTVPGESRNIFVNLEQDYKLFEVLSLKFTQAEVYTRSCADYGVVIGRVSSNHGFGIPNAKVSIFVPLSDEDADDPIISTLYPYKSTADRNEDGYRYNLLPYKKSHSGHAPTGTFPDKTDVLYREEVLEIYEKYYKYTAKTNNAGDFMIWGIPVGTHTIHVDVDMSDMGCFSIRPYDLMKQGVASLGKFKNAFEFKSSIDMDSLPQIVKFDKTIEVVPFWGQEDLCQIGITRTDFDFSELGISLQPTSMFIGSMVTDSGKLAVKKTGKPHKRQGYKCKLETYEGTVEAIRFTGRKYKDKDGNSYPELENVDLERMDDNGTWMCSLPMNMEHVITNEFGDEEITNDPNKGIATSAIYRFRLGMDYENRKIEVGSYLVPNIREFTGRADGRLEESTRDTRLSYVFSTDFDEYFRLRDTAGHILHQNNTIRDLILGKNNNGVPEDYFYKFTYNKVYTAASFHGTHFEGSHRDSFIGIKEILPNEDQDCEGTTNKLPVNFGFRNRINFQMIIALVLLFFKFLFKAIHIRIVEIVGGAMYRVGRALDVWPVRRPAERLQHAAIKWQEASQIEMPLTIYPICEECGTDRIEDTTNETVIEDLGNCMVASGTTVLLSFLSTNELGFASGSFQTVTPDTTLCPNATPLDYNSLSNLQNIVVNYNPDEGVNSRYAIAIYSLTGSTDQATVAPIGPGGVTFTWDGSNNVYVITFPSRDELFEFMTEADPQLPSGNSGFLSVVARQYKFEIYDLDGTKSPQLVIPQYEIEEGCDRYDTFYDESVLHPRKFIWAVDDDDYGSPLTSIDRQNSLIPLTGTSYGGGIFPAEVLRYVSYAEESRDMIISGLDPNLTYNIELVASRALHNHEDTTFTIQTTTQSLFVDYNLSTSVIFNTITPTNDTITITIDKSFNSLQNYINGFKITRNGSGAGSGSIFVNIYGGFDAYTDPQWNNFDVGIGEQENREMFNLKYTDGVTSDIAVRLTFSLNVATNDNVSEFQKIYFQPDQLTIVAMPPYQRTDYSIIASVAGTSSTYPLPAEVNYKRIGKQIYFRKTKTGFTEIRNGVITIVPVIRGKSRNMNVLKEWYHRTQIATAFCGGIANHSFIDNWLSGILYAFKFKFRKAGARNFIDGLINGRKFKYPRELVIYDIKSDLFYYRSCPFDGHKNEFIGQRNYYAGKFHREILRPTTITDLGPRDEFIDEICTDTRVDPNCSVIRDIGTTSYQNVEEILEYVINYRSDIANKKMRLKDFFNRKFGGVKLLDGDIIQLESINCEVGIDEFDLDSPKYFMYNGEIMDPENPYLDGYFRDNGPPKKYGPSPIDFKLDDDGRRIRLCLNHPDFLGESSQVVPFYLWDKKGEGFGRSGANYEDAQAFKKDLIVTERLQRIYSINFNFDLVVSGISQLNLYSPLLHRRALVMTSGTYNDPLTGQIYEGDGVSWVNVSPYTRSSNYAFPNGTEEYVLYPMTKEHAMIDFNMNGPDALERFDFVSFNPSDRFLYNNSPEGTLFLQVITGTVEDPDGGLFWVMLGGGTWSGPYSYQRNDDDVFITPTANNYIGNLQVLSTPYLYYFGLRPGKTSFDRFVAAFGKKGAFNG